MQPANLEKYLLSIDKDVLQFPSVKFFYRYKILGIPIINKTHKTNFPANSIK